MYDIDYQINILVYSLELKTPNQFKEMVGGIFLCILQVIKNHLVFYHLLVVLDFHY